MSLSKPQQIELDQLKDLRQVVTGRKSTSLVIYGNGANITLHAENGAAQNDGIFKKMMKTLKKELTKRIDILNSKQ